MDMAITPECCAYCRYMDLSSLKDGLNWCRETSGWKPATCKDSLSCRKGWRISSYGDQAKAEEAIKAYQKYERENRPYKSFSWFYISTAVIEILKKRKENTQEGIALDEQLSVLENFRLDYLQNNPELKEWMLMYDTIGPVLAAALKNDENKKQLAMDLYVSYLGPCVSLIKALKNEQAFSLYKEMVDCLEKHYRPQAIISDDVKDRYDQQNGGNGSIKLKPQV